MGLGIKVFLSIIKRAARANFGTQMGTLLVVNFRRIKLMDMAFTPKLVVRFITVILLMICRREMVQKYGQMNVNSRVTILKVTSRVRANTHGKMALSILGSGKTIKSTGLVITNGATAVNTKDNGQIIKCMASVFTITLMVCSTQASTS